MNVEIDTSVLTSRLRELQSALQAHGVDIVRSEAGQLAWEIGNKLGPRTLNAAGKRLDGELKRSFYVASPKTNLKPEQRFSKYPAFTWLYASPHALVGFEDQFDARDESTDELLRRHYKTTKGKHWFPLGRRGRQKIMKVQKPIVLDRQLAAVRRMIMSKVGESRAAFSLTASKLIPAKRIPGWIQKHFPTVESSGKSIYQPAGLADKLHPILDFGSRAKGVESNDKMNGKIHRAISTRAKIMAVKVKKVLAGWSYDWNTGAVFRKPPLENN